MAYTVAPNSQINVPVLDRKFFLISDNKRLITISTQWAPFLEKALADNKIAYFKKPIPRQGCWQYSLQKVTPNFLQWLDAQYANYCAKYKKAYTTEIRPYTPEQARLNEVLAYGKAITE